MNFIVFLLATVQFVNILDFVMVMPLGPDFAVDLNIPTSHLGWVVGSYTFAAFLSGILGFVFLDRFDRKKAFVFCVFGIAFATLLGGFSQGFYSLLFSRLIAGGFGGPASALALSIVAETSAPEARGKAMGILMGAFSLASVVGVPAGLELARLSSWRTPFFAIGTLGFLAALVSLRVLPPLRAHLEDRKKHHLTIKDLLTPKYSISLSSMGIAILSVFLIVPNLSTYLQFNLHWPRERLGLLYGVGGIFSLIAMQLGGRWIDRVGGLKVMILSSLIVAFVLWTGFIDFRGNIPILVIFTLFMTGSSLRNVTLQTLVSHVPPTPIRARYMSVQSALVHACSALGSFFSASMLSNDASGNLLGMSRLAIIAMGFTALLPFMVARLERLIGQR